jgi:tetratricopeptide (TPR) repeat protein
MLATYVRRVHGIPKALESLVGYLAERYPAITLDHLILRDEIFADFDRHDAHRGLKRLVREQFDDQAPDAKLLLCALSVFNRPVPVEAIRYMLPGLDWVSLVPRLVRNRLVKADNGLFDLHPLVREHAYACVPEAVTGGPSGAEFTAAALHDRAASFFHDLGRPADEWTSLDQLLPQLDEFHHRCCATQFGQAAQVIEPIDWHLRRLGYSHRVIEMRDRLVGKLADSDADLTNSVAMARCLDNVGQVQRSHDMLQNVLRKSDVSVYVRRDALMLLAGIESNRGDVATSEEYCTQVLMLARAGGLKWSEAHALQRLASCAAESGRIREALGLLNDAMFLEGSQIDADVLVFRGTLDFYMGDIADACEACCEGLNTAREEGSPFGEGYAFSILGRVAAYTGNVDVAIDFARESLRLAVAVDEARVIQGRSLFLSSLLIHADKTGTEADRLCERACMYPPLESNNLPLAMALCAFRYGRTDGWELVRKSLAVSVERVALNSRCWDAALDAVIASTLLNDRDAASKWYDRSLSITSLPGPAAMTLYMLVTFEVAGCAIDWSAEVTADLRARGSRMAQHPVDWARLVENVRSHTA